MTKKKKQAAEIELAEAQKLVILRKYSALLEAKRDYERLKSDLNDLVLVLGGDGAQLSVGQDGTVRLTRATNKGD